MFEIGLLILVVMGLTELVKRFKIQKRYLPIISLVFGLSAGIFYVEGPLKDQVLYGLIIGLSAAGLFDQSKIIKKGVVK